jgi:hypothetical protein
MPLRAADRMQPGKWEFTMTTNGATHSSTMCITAEKAASANGDTKSARAAAEKDGKGCDIKSYEVSGATVTYTIECHGTRIESTATYHGDRSEGVLKSTREGKTATTTVKARRLGACDAG